MKGRFPTDLLGLHDSEFRPAAKPNAIGKIPDATSERQGSSCLRRTDMPILPRAMSPKESTALRLDTALLEAMRAVKDAEGIPVTTQIEIAVREWLKKRGVVVEKPERKRAATRSTCLR